MPSALLPALLPGLLPALVGLDGPMLPPGVLHNFLFDFAGGQHSIDGVPVDIAQVLAVVSAARSSFNAAGLLVDFAANTPRITDRGLAIEPAITQLLGSSALSNPPWFYDNITGALDAVGPTGAVASAYTLTDASTATGMARYDTPDLSGGYANQVLMPEVLLPKHTADASDPVSGLRLRRLGGAIPDTTVYFNRRTGAYLGAVGTLPGGFTQKVTSCGAFWRIQLSYNHADNTSLSFRIIPVANLVGTATTVATAVGSVAAARAGLYHGPAIAKPDFLPVRNTSGAPLAVPADQAVLSVPAARYGEIAITFADGTRQSLTDVIVGPEGWTIPTNLNRALIASIEGAATIIGNLLFGGAVATFGGAVATFGGV